MQNVHLSPAEVALMLDINQSTVKRWIDQGILSAEKTAGGHRRIRREDLLTFVRKRESGVTRSYILRRVKAVKSAYTFEKYYSALYHGADDEAMRDLWSVYIAERDLLTLVETIMVPALVRVGEEWSRGSLDIADEHRISFMIREHLIKLKDFIPEPKKYAQTAVLACVPGENHELTLHMLALVLRQCGIRPIILGINVPSDGVIRTALKESASYVCITRGYSDTKGSILHLKTLLKGLPRTTLLIGGRGWTADDLVRIKRETPRVIYANSLRETLRILETLGKKSIADAKELK